MLIDALISILGVIVSLLTVAFFVMSVVYWSRKTEKSGRTPFVSVVIATMDEKDRIKQNIKGLLNQTYKKYEVIFIDESSDNTWKTIKKAARLYKRIKLIKLNGERRGKRKCLEIGIKKARGEIILYTDADCSPKKDWIQNMVNELDKSDMVISSAVIKARTPFDEIKKLEHLYYSAIIPTLALMVKSRIVAGWGGNMGFWKKSFNKIGGYKGIERYIAEDMALANKFREKRMKIVFSFKSLVRLMPEKNWLKQKIRWLRITRQGIGETNTIFYFYPMLFSDIIAVILSVIGMVFSSSLWWGPIVTLYIAVALCAVYIYIAIKDYKKILYSFPAAGFDFILKFIYLYSLFKKEVYWKGKIKV